VSALRALIVDDNLLIRDIVDRTLKSRGFETVQAVDAEAGIKCVEGRAMPHLAVIDVMLPGKIDGVGLCQFLRSRPDGKDAVIVMITASDKRKEADRSLSAGADILIGKPFSPRQFWIQVDSLLKDRRLRT